MNENLPILTWRLNAGLTQEEAGAMFSLEQGTFSRYERGVDKPGVKTAILIERVTGIPREQLRPDVFNAPPTKPRRRK